MPARQYSRQETNDFFRPLGGIHDGLLSHISWLPGDGVLEFIVKDIYSNFEGLPEYPGSQVGTFRFSKVSDFVLDDVHFCDAQRFIDEVSSYTSEGRQRCLIRLVPGGKLDFEYEDMSILLA